MIKLSENISNLRKEKKHNPRTACKHTERNKSSCIEMGIRQMLSRHRTSSRYCGFLRGIY